MTNFNELFLEAAHVDNVESKYDHGKIELGGMTNNPANGYMLNCIFHG